MSRFHGLIQHSFALQNYEQRPFQGKDVKEKVAGRFAHSAGGCGDFLVDEIPIQKCKPMPARSPLFEHELTTLDPQARGKFFEWNLDEQKYEADLPSAFSWANKKNKETDKERKGHWERIIFAKTEESGQLSLNDFLVRGCDSSEDQARFVSEMLCELLAARRSMLFGLALANNFVNVMLPHAILTPTPGDDEGSGSNWRVGTGSWILQPLVSLFRIRPNGSDFRRMYSLTFFLIPIEGSCCKAREMPKREMKWMVNAGWGLSASPLDLPRFEVSGPLPRYATGLEPSITRILAPPASRDETPEDRGGAKESTWDGLALRKATEAITYAVALRMALGQAGDPGKRVQRQIGDEVVSSLGNSRVSSAMVVDPDFNKEGLDAPEKGAALPGALRKLMPALAQRVRIPIGEQAGDSRKYRLDHPYSDHKDYAIGVLPSSRCLVVASDEKAQYGRWDSGLMQAGWIAYTVIAAASAIGTMRAINRDLETVDRSARDRIVDIEHDVAVDLHEIYDLDITWEAYRIRYRRLRELLGITSDYKALHGKLEALYRETSAHFEEGAQKGLSKLTILIVVFSVLIFAAEVLSILLE